MILSLSEHFKAFITINFLKQTKSRQMINGPEHEQYLE